MNTYPKPKQETIPPDVKLLSKVMELYHKTFCEDENLKKYLKEMLGLKEIASLTAKKTGYADGSLLKTVPGKGEIPEKLKKLGILDSDGKEIYKNCLIFPEVDPDGNCIKITGKKLIDVKKKT